MSNIETGYTDRRIPVPKEFEKIFTHFYIAKNDTARVINKILLPGFQTIMVFSFGSAITTCSVKEESIDLDKCMVLGPIKQPIKYALPVGAEMLVANFKDDAFYRFFGQVILSRHLPVNPDDLLDENCFSNLWSLIKGVDTADRINLVLDFCRPYLTERHTAFDVFDNFKQDYTVFNPIKVIAKATGQSERTIQLHHKKYFGYSAKEKSRYDKFIKTIQLLEYQAGKVDWFNVIETCGYYDQSQLIHDFKHFLNLSPNQYLKFQSAVCKSDPT